MTAYVLAAALGILLALLIGSIGRGRQQQRAYDLIAAQQRTLRSLDPESYAAKQLQQLIEAEVLLINNELVHPQARGRAAAWAVGCIAVLVAQLLWYLGTESPSRGDGIVAAFGTGFLGLQACGALQVVLHRNRILALAEVPAPADSVATAAEDAGQDRP